MSDNEKRPEGDDRQQDTATDAGEKSGDQGDNMFTQDQLNSFLAKERRELKEKYADYDANKEKAAKLDELEQEKMDEVDRERVKREKAEQQLADTLKLANDRLVRAAFIAEASKRGALHPADAYGLAMADQAEVSVDDDGNVIGVTDAVNALFEAKRLPVQSGNTAPDLNGGAGDGTRKASRPVALTELERDMARQANMTEEEYASFKLPPSDRK